MFRLCFAVVLVSCVMVLAQGARLSLLQQKYYNQQQFHQAAGLPFYTQQNQHRNSFNNHILTNYYRPLNEQVAKTINQQNDVRPDGYYQYSYETENGIRGQEQNIPKVLRSGELSSNAQGSYSYTSPEGLSVLVNYVADEDGFHPVLSYSGNGAAQFNNSPNPSSVIIDRRI